MTNDRRDDQGQPAASHGVYGISVVAELTGIPVQSLRLYESHGLLTPIRSDGGTRRYSADDLARLGRISQLVAHGVNLAGIRRIMDLEDDNAALVDANREMSTGSTGEFSQTGTPPRVTGTGSTAYIISP